MIDPTDDTYAEQEFHDNTDFLGSDDASLEMGVCAVAAAIIAWLFFKVLFWPVVIVSLAILAWRVWHGQTTPQALWDRIVALPGQFNRWRQRLHVKVVVKMLPEDVTDAEDLKGRLFHSPPVNLDHQHYRDTFAILALTDRTEEQDLQLAQYLRGLKAYGEDPLRMMAGQLKRKMAPSTKPVKPDAPQGLIGMPIPGLTMLTQYMMVAIVVLGGFGFWQYSRANSAAKGEAAAKEQAFTAEARNRALADRIKQGDEALREMSVNMEDYQNRVAAMQRQDAQRRRALAASQAKEKDRVEQARARADGSAPGVSDDDWLRNVATVFAPPADGSHQRPADAPASPAEGVAGGVSGTSGGGAAPGAADPQP